MNRLFFTVTNDLVYDQRMQRICGSLARQGYEVTLVGRQLPHSVTLRNLPFRQKRIPCWFHKGFLFYAEYNIRLFFFLLSQKMDLICAIDLDTIVPCLLVSRIRRCRRVYDAHEYFTELKEVHTRPPVQKIWRAIERWALPQFPAGYTVGTAIASQFRQLYGVQYEVIRNMPVISELPPTGSREPFILYQGAVNEGRGFEYLIPAFLELPYRLVICGDGNYMEKLKQLIAFHQLEKQVELKGMIRPEELRAYTLRATLGIALTEKEGLNQYYALPNKFFDYIEAGLPQIAMNFPEYRKVNERFQVAELVDELSEEGLAQTIRALMENPDRLRIMHEQCLLAREEYCWQEEEKKLAAFYHNLEHA